MRAFFSPLIMLGVSLVLFYSLNHGYYRGELRNYNAVNDGEIAHYLNTLLRFDLLIVFFNALLLFFGCRSFSKKKSVNAAVKPWIWFIFYSINIIDSLAFAVKNYIRNYREISELNVFPELLEKYGIIVNLVYIGPLILSVVIFFAFIFILKRRMNRVQ